MIKFLILATSASIGGGIGAMIGFHGLYWLFSFLDRVNETPAGGGYVSAGWIFTFVTVPVCAIFGFISFGWLTNYILEKNDKKKCHS